MCDHHMAQAYVMPIIPILGFQPKVQLMGFWSIDAKSFFGKQPVGAKTKQKQIQLQFWP